MNSGPNKTRIVSLDYAVNHQNWIVGGNNKPLNKYSGRI